MARGTDGYYYSRLLDESGVADSFSCVFYSNGRDSTVDTLR